MMKGISCKENSWDMSNELYLMVASPLYKTDKTIFFESKQFGVVSVIPLMGALTGYRSVNMNSATVLEKHGQ
jgi:hypothetical protein